ncbi:MAG TPA: glucosamine-6-phosphate deaminase [Planctomycetota bacterium]|nr:glucosamine-6-phosphate deaminase [Planctomycetota bacterium]
MRVVVVKSLEDMGKEAGAIVAEGMRAKPHYVVGLATGDTPKPLYRELIRLHKEEDMDFSTTVTFNLDEYLNLPATHDQSYRYFMDHELFNHVNIVKANTHVPDGMSDDVETHCMVYEAMIEDVGGMDCQVLGIGRNGHIGFNEPGSSLASRTRAVDLTDDTIEANSRMFANIEDVPKRAITMGIGTILESEKIIMLATGPGKAAAVAAALEGPVSVKCPASALQLHPDVTFVITEDAGSRLTLKFRR